MRTSSALTGFLFLTLVLTACVSPPTLGSRGTAVSSVEVGSTSSSPAPGPVDYGRLPLLFVENRGQLDSRVAYYLRSSEGTAYFTSDGVTFALSERQPHAAPDMSGRETAERLRPVAFHSSRENTSRRWALKLDFVGSNANVVPQGRIKSDAIVSYLIGPQSQWHPGLRTYTSIGYSELWPGIDLVYSGDRRHLKYTLILNPGADPKQIKLRYRGASSVQRTADGRLEVTTPVGTMYEEKPYVYQDIDGRRVEVAAGYDVEPAAAGEGGTYGFQLGQYRRDLPLVLDPFFSFAGYIGSGSTDEGLGIAVDVNRNAYVTGYTTIDSDLSFPETVGLGLGVTSKDAFVAKIDASGSAFVYISYVGGFGNDEAHGIAVDGDGNAYITGYSDDASGVSFPHGTGFLGLTSFDSTFNGGFVDAFVAKLDAPGTTLLYAGYLGGNDDDAGFGIAIDFDGEAYVTGGTCSDQYSFPDGDGFGALTGPDLTYNGGSGGYQYFCDGFVAKVNATGDQLVYAGYIGGSNYDQGNGIAVTPGGSAYVTGSTGSNQSTFPDTYGPDTSFNGGGDAFIAKVKVDGSGLVFAGYLGGGGKDEGRGIALRRQLIANQQSNSLSIVYTAFVTGSTETHAVKFPTVIGPDTTHNGSHDAFVARVSSGGLNLVFSGFIGGSGYDVGNGITVDSNGYAFVAGRTTSTEATFPVKSGPDLTYNGNGDAFVVKVQTDGSGLVYGSYIGGNGLSNPNFMDDFGAGVAVDTSGNAYVTGGTYSDQTTFPDGDGFGGMNGPDTTYNGYRDAFVVKIRNFLLVPVTTRPIGFVQAKTP